MKHPFPPGAQVVAYLRASTGNQQDMSTARQEAEIRSWCAANAITLSRLFVDDDRSGSTVQGREAFDAMLRYFDAEPPESGIVFWEYSRLSRSYDDAAYYLAGLRRRGYAMHSILDAIPEGPVGRVVESLYLWAAEDERKRLGERVRSGQTNVIVHHHIWPHSWTPTGYARQTVEIGARRDGSRHVASRLVPDPATASRVRQAFDLAARGYSMLEIMQQTGIYRDPSSVAKMLANEIYIGKYTHRGLYVEDFCPPLVSPELFAAANAARARRFHPRTVRAKRLLCGLLFCANCGSRMTINHAGYNGDPANPDYAHDYYICTNLRYYNHRVPGTCKAEAIDADLLEAQVLGALRQVLSAPAVIEAIYQAMPQDDRHARHAASVDEVRVQMVSIKRQIERILDAIATRPGSAALIGKLDDLEQQQSAARKRLSELEAEAPPAPLDLESLHERRAALAGKLDQASGRELQLLLRSLSTHVAARRVGRHSDQFAGAARFDLGVVVEVDF